MSDVLRRKIGAVRTPKKGTSASLETVMRKTMPRDADTVLSLDLSVQSFGVSVIDGVELRGGLAPFDLIYPLQTDDGACGLAVLDPGLTSAIVEVQVAGRVSEKPPPERAPTRTDGFVAGEIVDRWLDSAEAAVQEAGLEAAWPFLGFERRATAINRREAELLLEPTEFRTLDIMLTLGKNGRAGRLRLAAPRPRPMSDQKPNTTAERVRGRMPDLPVQLRVILTRTQMSMSQIRGLHTDTHLPMPEDCLSRVRLETSDGRLIQRVRLGQLGGRKAVRLSDRATAVSGSGPSPDQDVASIPKAAAANAPDISHLPEPRQSETATDAPKLPELPQLPELPEELP